MLDSQRLAQFALASLMLIVIPGPATLYVAAHGRARLRSGVLAVAGVIAGDIVLITLSGLGFAALIARWPIAFMSVRIAGAAYLAYLGLGMVRAAPAPAASVAARPVARALLGGLGITLTNPKPLLFFATFFGAFIAPDAPSQLASFYALGGIFESINAIYFAAILLVVSRGTFARVAGGRFHRACGLVLLGVAVAMLIATLR